MRPPKPYTELSLSEFADRVGELAQSEASSRMEINMALAEVYARLQKNPEDGEVRQLDDLRETLHRWLQADDDRRMGGYQPPWVGELPPFPGGICMCSIERLETRAKRG